MTNTVSDELTGGGRGRWRVGVGFAIATAYCLAMLVQAQPYFPSWLTKLMSATSSSVHGFSRLLLRSVGVDRPGIELGHGTYLLVVAGLIPLAVGIVVLRGTPKSLGCRVPNRYGWRLLLLGFVLALPFVIFMGTGSGMQRYYLPTLKRAGAAGLLSYYAVNMLTEHFLFHGVMLAGFRPSGRWAASILPAVDTTVTGCCAGLRRWLGLGVRTAEPGEHPLAVWLGLPPHCGFAIFGSGVLFALVHLGKDWREAVLSLPGGLAIAYMAYRGDSLVIPLLLHALTAGTTLGIMVLL